AIDNNPGTGWAVSPSFGRPHAAVFEVAGKLGTDKGTALTVTLDQQFPGGQHNIGRFRLSVTTDKNPALTGGLPDAIAKVLAVPAEKRPAEQKAALATFYRATHAELAHLRQQAAQV